MKQQYYSVSDSY